MTQSRVREIKHAQKESLLLHQIAQFFIQIVQDEPTLQGLSITRVRLSPDKGMCTVLFHAQQGKQEFEQKRPTLVLYKASMRKALSQTIRGRYTPNLRFVYDEKLDKQRRVDDLIEKLKQEGKL